MLRDRKFSPLVQSAIDQTAHRKCPLKTGNRLSELSHIIIHENSGSVEQGETRWVLNLGLPPIARQTVLRCEGYPLVKSLSSDVRARIEVEHPCTPKNCPLYHHPKTITVK